MNITSIASSAASAASAAHTGAAVQVSALKKALNAQSDAATTLLQGVTSQTPAPTTPSAAGGLGGIVNTFA